jgi:hypothetical protein
VQIQETPYVTKKALKVWKVSLLWERIKDATENQIFTSIYEKEKVTH